MMRCDAVIFDLDGTLLNTLDDLAASTNRALDHFCLPERTLDEVRQFVGNGVEKLIRRAVPAGTDEALVLDCLAWFKQDYMLHMQDQTGPYPGIIDLLKALRDNGCKAAVVSNKFDGAVKALCREHFGDLLPVAIGERPGTRKSPPGIWWTCASPSWVSRRSGVSMWETPTWIFRRRPTPVSPVCR